MSILRTPDTKFKNSSEDYFSSERMREFTQVEWGEEMDSFTDDCKIRGFPSVFTICSSTQMSFKGLILSQ